MKLALAKSMMGKKGASKAKASTTSSFSREELRDLFSFVENTLCDTHDLVISNYFFLLVCVFEKFKF